MKKIPPDLSQIIKNAKNAGIKLYFPTGELGEKPPIYTPDFMNIVLDAIWGREVQWIDPVSQKMQKGKVKCINRCVSVLKKSDTQPNWPSNSYILDVVSKGKEYSLSPEEILFADA